MSDYLAGHPQIFMARKEMHFFGSDLKFAKHFYRRAEREYLAEFQGAENRQRAGEASVWYLFSKRAAGEIKTFEPEARIIVLLREPVEMMYSLYQYFRYDGNEPLDAFPAALAAEGERRSGRGGGRQTYFSPGLVYRDTARFAEQVQRYFDVFGRERVHVMLLEDLARDPAAAYRGALRFLGVDATVPLPKFAPVNAARTVKSRAVRAVLNDPATRAAVLAMRPWVPERMFNVFHHVERVLTRKNSAVAPAPPLDSQLKADLQREFAKEVETLGKLIGRDLSHWQPPGGQGNGKAAA